MPRNHRSRLRLAVPILLVAAGTAARAKMTEGEYRTVECPASFTISLGNVKDGNLEIWNAKGTDSSSMPALSQSGVSWAIEDAKAVNLKFTGKFEATVAIGPRSGPKYQFAVKVKTSMGFVKGYEVTDIGWEGAAGPWSATFRPDNVTKVEKTLLKGTVASGGGAFLSISR